MKIHGFHAVMAVFARRPESIVRAYVTNERLSAAGALLKWCASHKKAYHVVTAEELAKVLGTPHHEGIAVLTKAKAAMDFGTLLDSLAADQQPTPLIYCDGVANPHTLGSMFRTAAHFGVPCVIGASRSLPALSPAICRVAEGAAEAVDLVHVNDPLRALRALKDLGFKLYGTSSHKGESLFGARIAPRAVIVLGSEGQGMSPALTQLCDGFLQIPGTGAVESLNVGVACGLILGEFRRAFSPSAPAR